MPKINIDELCEPIEITVGDKEYILKDVPQEVAKRMSKLGEAADELQEEIIAVSERLKKAKEAGVSDVIDKASGHLKKLRKQAEDSDSTTEMIAIMTKLMGAEKGELAKLGVRKRLMLVKSIMETITEELEGKNVPEAAATK